MEEKEAAARAYTLQSNPIALQFLDNLDALLFYLISIETFLTCTLTDVMTVYWVFNAEDSPDWDSGRMHYIVLAFAVTISPGVSNSFSSCCMHKKPTLIKNPFRQLLSVFVWPLPT